MMSFRLFARMQLRMLTFSTIHLKSFFFLLLTRAVSKFIKIWCRELSVHVIQQVK